MSIIVAEGKMGLVDFHTVSGASIRFISLGCFFGVGFGRHIFTR
jgi:hypothetical protein